MFEAKLLFCSEKVFNLYVLNVVLIVICSVCGMFHQDNTPIFQLSTLLGQRCSVNVLHEGGGVNTKSLQ